MRKHGTPGMSLDVASPTPGKPPDIRPSPNVPRSLYDGRAWDPWPRGAAHGPPRANATK